MAIHEPTTTDGWCLSTDAVRAYTDDGRRLIKCTGCGADVTDPNDVNADQTGRVPLHRPPAVGRYYPTTVPDDIHCPLSGCEGAVTIDLFTGPTCLVCDWSITVEAFQAIKIHEHRPPVDG